MPSPSASAAGSARTLPPHVPALLRTAAAALLACAFSLPLAAQIIGGSGDQRERDDRRQGPGGLAGTAGGAAGEEGAAGARIGEMHFSYLLPLDEGDIGIYALNQEQPSPDVWIGSGYVDIRYQETRLQADKVTLYLVTKDVVAEGNVVFDLPGQRMTGERAELNLLTGLGTIWEGSGFFQPGIYVQGEELEHYQKDWIRVKRGIFTSCDQPTPDWSFRVGRGRLHVNQYAFLNLPRLQVKKAPILALPYLVWPIKTERSSGLLFPRLGMSQWRGFHLGQQYYWVISRSADATFTYDHYTKWGNGMGVEARYYVGEWGSGFLDSYLLRDKIDNSNRWKVEWEHVQELLYDWRVGANVDMNSDFNFSRDFYDDFSEFSTRTSHAEGYASRSWSYYSFNLLAQQTDTLYTATQWERNQRETPTVELDGLKRRLFGSLVYFEFESSFGRLHSQESRNKPRIFQRLDLAPALSLPIKKIPWLKITPELGYRYTLYDRRVPLDPKGEPIGDAELLEEKLARRYLFSQFELVGPSFARIFNTPRNFFSEKYKHLIEPQFAFNYISPIDNAGEVPYFDFGDRVLEVNEVSYGIVNRLFAKRRVTEESAPTTQELLTLEISQKYSLDPELNTSYGRRFNPFTGGYYGTGDDVQRRSPVRTRLRLSPSRFYSIDYEFYYDQIQDRTVETRVAIRLNRPEHYYFNLSYYDDPIFDREQLLGSVGTEFFDRRLKAEVSTQYEFTRKYFPRWRGLLLYSGQCYGVYVEYLEYSYYGLGGAVSDRRIEAALNLTHVGDILRFRTRTSPRGSNPYD